MKIEQISVDLIKPYAKNPRTGYNNRAHAVRLRDRLNQLFNTTDFEIKEII